MFNCTPFELTLSITATLLEVCVSNNYCTHGIHFVTVVHLCAVIYVNYDWENVRLPTSTRHDDEYAGA